MTQSPQFRKLMKVAKDEIKLTDDERKHLADYLLRRDITSWKDLDEAQVLRLLDACEGWQLIQTLISQRF